MLLFYRMFHLSVYLSIRFSASRFLSRSMYSFIESSICRFISLLFIVSTYSVVFERTDWESPDLSEQCRFGPERSSCSALRRHPRRRALHEMFRTDKMYIDGQIAGSAFFLHSRRGALRNTIAAAFTRAPREGPATRVRAKNSWSLREPPRSGRAGRTSTDCRRTSRLGQRRHRAVREAGHGHVVGALDARQGADEDGEVPHVEHLRAEWVAARPIIRSAGRAARSSAIANVRRAPLATPLTDSSADPSRPAGQQPRLLMRQQEAQLRTPRCRQPSCPLAGRRWPDCVGRINR